MVFNFDPCAEAQLALLDLGVVVLADFVLATSTVVVGELYGGVSRALWTAESGLRRSGNDDV